MAMVQDEFGNWYDDGSTTYGGEAPIDSGETPDFWQSIGINPDTTMENWESPSNAEIETAVLGNSAFASLFKQLGNKALDLLKTDGKYDPKKLLALAGGAYATTRPSGPALTGFQGKIPSLSATRNMLTAPPVGRRPGSGGIDYGGGVTYRDAKGNIVSSNERTLEELRQAAINNPFNRGATYEGQQGGLGQSDLAQLLQLLNPPGGTAPAPTPVTTTPGTGAPSPSASSDSVTKAIQDWYKANEGRGDQAGLDKWLATSGYTPEQINKALPQWGTEDLRKAQRNAEIKQWYSANQGKGDQAALDKWLATSGYTPEEINSALPQWGVDDLNKAITSAKTKLSDGTFEDVLYGTRAPAQVRPSGGLADIAPSPNGGASQAPASSSLFTVGGDGTGYVPPKVPLNSMGLPVTPSPGEPGSPEAKAAAFEKQQTELQARMASRAAAAASGAPKDEFALSGGVYANLAAGGLTPDGFVLPADVVSHYGNGSSEAGLKLLASKLGAQPIKGDGDGMSDSIPTTIGGKQEARVANDEAFIPPEMVKRIGDGDVKKGAKKLYAMMDKIRKERTGTKEQGKQIDPNKFMPGGSVQKYQTGGTTATRTVPANATGSESSLSNWAGDYVTNMLGQGAALANAPYQAYTGPLTAGSSQLQNQAFNMAGNLRTPGSIGQAAGTAGGIANLAANMRYTPQTTDFLGGANVSGLGVAPSYGIGMPQQQSAPMGTPANPIPMPRGGMPTVYGGSLYDPATGIESRDSRPLSFDDPRYNQRLPLQQPGMMGGMPNRPTNKLPPSYGEEPYPVFTDPMNPPQTGGTTPLPFEDSGTTVFRAEPYRVKGPAPYQQDSLDQTFGGEGPYPVFTDPMAPEPTGGMIQDKMYRGDSQQYGQRGPNFDIAKYKESQREMQNIPWEDPSTSIQRIPGTMDFYHKDPNTGIISRHTDSLSTTQSDSGMMQTRPMESPDRFAVDGGMTGGVMQPPSQQAGLPGLMRGQQPQASQPVGNIAQQYMNPYLESALRPQMAEMQRAADIARLADASRLTQAGAYGGSRQAIMEAEGRRNLLGKQTEALGQGYATAYDKAMAQFNADQARRAQEAQFGATFGLQGLQTGLQGAQTQAQAGALQSQADLANLRGALEAGGIQRGIESEGIAADKAQFEEARLNPFKMLQFQQSLLSGMPLASQSYNIPGQSNLQQFASGATGIQQLLDILTGKKAAPTKP